MKAIKRLAIGLNFEPLDHKYNTVDVYRCEYEAHVDGDYEYNSFKDDIPIDGRSEVSVKDYNEYIKTYTKQEYEKEVRFALARLEAIGKEVAGVIEEGIILAKDLGIDWEIEVDKYSIEPTKLKYVDWQSSTIECAMNGF